ncbi:hypothetical protein EGW08_015726, partial [Elysia chlorotica]
LQSRTKGDVDFDRDWADYKNGFGNISGDFWLGNDAIHNLTSTVSEDLLHQEKGKFGLQYATKKTLCKRFVFFSYRLRLGSYSGVTGKSTNEDGLSYLNNQPFTTKDRDNDSDLGNCAVLKGEGWWYKRC